jgi:tricorn protease-like protein
MRPGHFTAVFGCLLLGLLIFSGCAGNPKGVYRALYGVEPPVSELATLDPGAAYELIIDDRYYVSRGEYDTVKLPAGNHRI